jgi:phage-related protein
LSFFDVGVKAAFDVLPLDIRAMFQRIVELIQSHGLERVREPYLKHLEGPIWEMRMKGRSGIARAAYVTARGRRIVSTCVFQEVTEDAAARDRNSSTQGEGGSMIRKSLPVSESFKRWEKNPH